MRKKEKPVMPIKKREDVHRVAEYLRERYQSGEMLRIMFLTGCNTGLTAGELRNLKIETLLNQDSFTVWDDTAKKARQVYINTALKQEIKRYIYEPKITNKICGDKNVEIIKLNMQDKSDFIFIGGQGAAVGVKYMHSVISGACRNLGIKGNYGSLSMAKTFAFHVFQRTGDVNIVQSILMHSDRSLTMNYIYDRRSLRMAKRAINNGNPENVEAAKNYFEINLI